MAGLPLEKGTAVQFHHRRYTCDGRGPGGGYRLVPHKGRHDLTMKPEAAYDALVGGKLTIVADADEYEGTPLPESHFDLQALPEKEQKDVLFRHFTMKALEEYRAEGGTLSTNALKDFSACTFADYKKERRKAGQDFPDKPMSPAAIRRWFRKWKESGCALIALVRDRKGNSHTKLSIEQKDLLDDAIENHYMDKRRIPASKAHELMTAKINVLNRRRTADNQELIPVPHYNTLLAHINSIDVYEVLKARYNAQYAWNATRLYGTTPPCTRHLERVQMDHTILDLYVDFGQGLLFRPTITLAMDLHSKAILGFWISNEPACAESVMQTLKMAALPKDMVALGGEPNWYWPMYGIPSELTLDNGKEFHGDDLKIAAAELGITLNYTPPRKPWHKAQIERKFGEINRSLLSQLPGQVFKYEPEKHGLDYPHLTLNELRRIFLEWITTVLHRKPNKAGQTPEALWLDSVQKHGTPASGFDCTFIEVCLSKSHAEGKRVHEYGIEFHNLTYQNEWLSRLYNKLAPKSGRSKPMVQIKWSAADVGKIWVLHPETREFFSVPAKQKEAHGRSHYNHKVICREVRNRRKAGMSDTTYTDAILAVEQTISDAVAKKTTKKKKQASKVVRFNDGSPKTSASDLNAPGDPPYVTTPEGDHVDPETGEIQAAGLPEDDFEEFADDLGF